jgi:phage shock protein PspC (stress-responsive transcriptional regulator)
MTTTASPSTLDRTFAALHRSPITRSNGKLGGVCAGLAQHFTISSKVARIATVILALLGVGVPLYLLGWLLLPDQNGQVHLERAIRGGQASSIVLLVVTALSVIPDVPIRHFGGWAWLAVIIVAVVMIRRAGSTTNPAPWNQSTAQFPSSPQAGPQDSPRA